jgi:hypothetical protein
MDDQVSRLIHKFNLRHEVEEFVRRRAVELSEQKTPFRFEGSGKRCGSKEPHAPHISGEPYSTVRYGMLQTFCRGVSGEGMEIISDLNHVGSAESPARFHGHFIGTAKVSEPAADPA